MEDLFPCSPCRSDKCSPVHVLCSSGSAKRNFFFLLDPSLVRGYESTSFEPAECGTNAQATGTCPVFARLIGSRIAVGNVEVRVPLFGPLGIVPKTQFVPPVEVALFVDVGLAWTLPASRAASCQQCGYISAL
jgi:outer membrane protein assembly factor BamA